MGFFMIGIIGALTVEVEALKARMKNIETQAVSGIEFACGEIHGKRAVVAVCGVGKVNAALCTQTMILKYSPAVIVNTGVAGSLSPTLKIGDIAVAEGVVQHDFDITALGEERGLIPGVNVVEIKCSERVSALLCDAVSALPGIHFQRGIVATGDQFLFENEIKNAVTKNFGAIVCEMEGGSIGQVCAINKIPFGIIRAVSDNADDSADSDFPAFCAKAAENSLMAMDYFIKSY